MIDGFQLNRRGEKKEREKIQKNFQMKFKKLYNYYLLYMFARIRNLIRIKY